MSVLRRLLESLIVVWAVATAAFFALRLGRVDPLAALAAQGLATEEQTAEMRRALGLDRPLLEQYTDYFGDALRGDLGRSLFSGQDVAAMIAEAAKHTVPLAAAAWILAVVLGIGLGAVAARRAAGIGPGIGGLVSALLAVGASTPAAWLGLIILWASIPLFAVSAAEAWREALRLFLPAAALALTVGCGIGRAAEASIRQVRGEPFHLAMRARGFPRGWRADWRLLRAAIAPVLAMAGMEAAFLLGGTMITEVVFARPGLGRTLVDAVLRGDYPVVQALLGLAALAYTLLGMAADFSAAVLDPRVREAA
ncbi:MAG: ABC transporter permease [Anaerolineales bacterium]|nr:ABC transporter permease [Anaerolineales bacterium]